ncbi:MAG TPA: hypothetical protein VF188_08885 [Longimicrobiales bacterium]
MRPGSRHLLLCSLCGFLPLSAPAVLGAQTISLDEGSLQLLVGGREVGRETFTIRQNGTGPAMVIIARGAVVLDTAGAPQQLQALLRVEGPGLRPASYNLNLVGGNGQRIAGQLVGNRFSARILSSAGEQMREYLASEGAVLVEEGIAHHHYFLARRFAAGMTNIPVIIPRRNLQISAVVTDAGSGSVDVGGRAIRARHLVISPTGAPERHLWVDDDGRILRLEIPARAFVARREAPPG